MANKKLLLLFVTAGCCLASALKKTGPSPMPTTEQQTFSIFDYSGKNSTFKIGQKEIAYESLHEQCTDKKLFVKGKLPVWLKGSLLRTGSGLFELGNKRVKNWFNGLAMLYRFTIKGTTITYSNKFLESEYYKNALKNNAFPSTFAEGEKTDSFFSKLSNIIHRKPLYDNGNVNILSINGKYMALGGTPLCVTFNPDDLSTLGAFVYKDKLKGDTCTAYPLYDEARREWVNVMTEFGKKSHYHIYKMAHNSTERKLIQSISTPTPSYIHSFALTPNYIILTLIPFVVNPFDLLTSSKGFLENFTWKPELKNEIIVIKRDKGTLVTRLKTDAFVVLHHANAFEDNDVITIDMITYKDNSIINNGTLQHLTTTSLTTPSFLERLTINTTQKSIAKTPLSETILKIPTINKKYALKNHSIVYAVGGEFDHQLIKFNITTKKTSFWQEDGCYPGEAIFVPRPGSILEDDGVILSVVIDTIKKYSFLLVLHAQTFKEIARAHIPHMIPLGFHGNFYPS